MTRLPPRVHLMTAIANFFAALLVFPGRDQGMWLVSLVFMACSGWLYVQTLKEDR